MRSYILKPSQTGWISCMRRKYEVIIMSEIVAQCVSIVLESSQKQHKVWIHGS